jgi:hypothetical protein
MVPPSSNIIVYAACAYQISVSAYKTTWCHMPEKHMDAHNRSEEGKTDRRTRNTGMLLIRLPSFSGSVPV